MTVHLATYSPASARDTEAIRRLLAENALPSDDIDRHLGDFIVLRIEGSLAGVAGLEIVGEVALLRSVAVAKERRRNRMGLTLCEKVLARARERGAKTVYLLTLTAASFFQKKLGFVAVDRADVPPAIQDTCEFQSACPASASVLMRDL